jgi:hypothetical protein
VNVRQTHCTIKVNLFCEVNFGDLSRARTVHCHHTVCLEQSQEEYKKNRTDVLLIKCYGGNNHGQILGGGVGEVRTSPEIALYLL